MENKFYVYKWFNVETNEIFYIGKGSKNRYKQVTQRNKLFKEYLNKNNCKSEILQYFENEIDAFEYEHNLIIELKQRGMCSCNLDHGGRGGCNFSWTQEMRDYKSKYNPMKDSYQKMRMSINNPMKNKEIAKHVGEKTRKAVIIDGTRYEGVKIAAKALGVWDITISRWCKRGYNTEFKPCRYADSEQKEYKVKISNSRAVIINGKRFNSVREAAKYYNTWSETIIRNIRKHHLLFGKYKCEYDNQQAS